MNKILSMFLSSAFGILVCFALITVANSMHITPRFPAFAGEDDFGKRISFFVFFVCPGFAIIGAWIGRVFSLEKRIGSFMWGGVIAASAVTFAFAYFLSPFIDTISASDVSNVAVFALLFFWVVLSALGGWLVRVIFLKQRYHELKRNKVHLRKEEKGGKVLDSK